MKRSWIAIFIVSLALNVGLFTFILFSKANPFRSEASVLSPTASTNDIRVGTIVARDGVILTLADSTSSEIAIIVAPVGTPVRMANENGQFAIADEAKLTKDDTVAMQYVDVSGIKVLQSIDILEDK